jgi:uncharacterized damage-inducible protein DinB
MDLKDYFESTWEARARLFAACEALEPDEWTREFPFSWKSIRNLFAHIIEVEASWIEEDIERRKWTVPDEVERARLHATVAASRSRGDEIAQSTRKTLAAYVPARLHEKREGKQIDGTVVEFTVEQILTHVFTHELRHQGQVQVMLRLLGKAAPNADWI